MGGDRPPRPYGRPAHADSDDQKVHRLRATARRCLVSAQGRHGPLGRQARRSDVLERFPDEWTHMFVMPGHSRPKDGVASARLCPGIHVFTAAKTWMGRGRPATTKPKTILY